MYGNWYWIWGFGFKTSVLYNAPLNDQLIHCYIPRRQFTAAEMCSVMWKHCYDRRNEKMDDLSVVTSLSFEVFHPEVL